jgi:hypothetical protein
MRLTAPTARLLRAPAAVIVFLGFAAFPARADVTSPEQHLGRPVGADFTLADWAEVGGYYRKLADQSPRVRVSSEGKTTEGRDFLLAVISSEENLRNLDQIKAHARTLADPRGKSAEQKEQALRDGKVIVAITPAMHATEVAATQMGMELAYKLATSEEEPWRSARQHVVVVMPPTLNPDGLDHVAEWYRKTVRTPHEGAALPKLYQYYTGHDNNRDWFMLTQAETRIMSRLAFKEWLPQVYWDVHQQGAVGERIVLPPYRDPLNPNLDPGIVAAINLVGTRAVLDMTGERLTGVATGGNYDMWWHGGNRGVPVRHNMVGILTEAASANLASPVFHERADLRLPQSRPYQPSNTFITPWPGGWWRVRDIIDYELAFARSLLGQINREPRLWRANTLAAAERAVAAGRSDGVRGWVIPASNRDPSAVRRLVDALLGSGVEVHTSGAAVSADGRAYPAGSIVIRRDQPFAAHVKDLFDVQRYPPGEAPYDVAGWSLPLLMGVQRVEVMQSVDDWKLTRVESGEAAVAGFDYVAAARRDAAAFDAGGRAFFAADSGNWTEAARLLKEGRTGTFTGGRWLFPPPPATSPTTSSVPTTSSAPTPSTAPSTGQTTARIPADSHFWNPSNGIKLSRLPRIGVYAPWTGSMDEGWLRWVFDTWQIPYVSVRNEALRAGRLTDFLDVLVIADASPASLERGRPAGSVPDALAGGLAPEGSVAVEEFVRAGGTLVTFKSASKWAIDLLQVPLADVTVGDEAKGFACPGSVLRGVPVPNALTAGLPESVPLFFSSAAGWREKRPAATQPAGPRATNVQPLLRYAPTQLLLSGYIAKPEVLEGQAAWVRAEYGRGRVHLFGFQPHYRGWSQATFPLIFRAALLEPLP